MPTVFLHSGAHKTGTSTFQAFIQAHRDTLSEKGLHVPAAGQDPGGAHHRLVRALSGLPGPPALAPLPEALAAELRQHPEHDVLISSESLGNVLRVPWLLERYVGLFAELGYDVAVIHYFRHTPLAINSAYSQEAKSLTTLASFDAYARNLLDRHRANTLVETLLGNSRVRVLMQPYNAAVRQVGIVQSIMTLLNLGEAPDVERANVSPGPLTIHLARWLGRRFAAEGLLLHPRQKAACARIVADLVQREQDRAKYMGLTTRLAAAIEKATKAKNDCVARRLWGVAWADSFPSEIDLDYASNDHEMIPGNTARDPAVQNLQDQALDRARQALEDPRLSQSGPWPATLIDSMRAVEVDLVLHGLRSVEEEGIGGRARRRRRLLPSVFRRTGPGAASRRARDR